MRLNITFDADRLCSYLPAFVALSGEDRWKKRAVQLGVSASKSPWEMKVVADYHWLEMELTARLMEVEYTENLACRVTARTLAALRFAATVVEVHRRLPSSGKTAIEGRLRDSLKSGFPALYLEMELAQLLMEDGFDVTFPDLEGGGNVDLQFTKGLIDGEVECKSQSVDAGRKIHRKDYYRFIDTITPSITDCAKEGRQDVFVITIADRFPHDDNRQRVLIEYARRALADHTFKRESYDWFVIERRPLCTLGIIPVSNNRELHAKCREMFGEQCHVAGLIAESGACLVVAFSQQVDDASKPLLEAMKKASEQLSTERPGFVAVQFNDVEPQDLALAHLRRKSAILSEYLFRSRDSRHLAAVYFCAYAGLHAFDGIISTPAFACWNPQLRYAVEGLPFRHTHSDDDFRRILPG